MTSFMKEQNVDFSKLMDDCFLSPEEFAERLDKGIEMLFYIEDNTFHKKDIQNVVFALKRTSENLRKQE